MKVPLSWLENYVQLPPVSELLPRLTEIGHMVDGFVRLPNDQCIVSLEIRTNRPDCLSILGIAREIGAAFRTPVREVRLADLPHKVRQSAAEAPDYVCFLCIKGARLDRLPAGMREALDQYGQGSINPFVDLANYVMVELGQPLHVYIASKVDIASAQSRLARVGVGSSPTSWHQTCQPDFYTLKAEAEAVLETLGLSVFSEASSPIPFPFQVGKSCCLLDKSRQVVGYVGEVDHQAYSLKPVRKSFAVEIYLPVPSLRQAKRMSAPRRRVDSFDISVLADENTKVSTIQELVGETLGEDLVTMRLIDTYTGEQVKAGSRSFTFRIVYARSRGEPSIIWREIVSIITQRLYAEVRGAN